MLPGAGQLGRRLGLEALVAVVAGAGALWARRRAPRDPRSSAAAVLFGGWLVTGVVLFSAMPRLHLRYLEAPAPAVAAVLGLGAAGPARGARGRPGAVALVVAALAPGAVTAAQVAGSQATDGGTPGARPAAEVGRLSAFLRTHRSGRYEAAEATPDVAAPLIARDGLAGPAAVHRPARPRARVPGRPAPRRRRRAGALRVPRLLVRARRRRLPGRRPLGAPGGPRRHPRRRAPGAQPARRPPGERRMTTATLARPGRVALPRRLALRAAQAVGVLAMVSAVALSFGFVAAAAARPSALSPPSRVAFPGWLAGPLHGVLTATPRDPVALDTRFTAGLAARSGWPGWAPGRSAATSRRRGRSVRWPGRTWPSCSARRSRSPTSSTTSSTGACPRCTG